MLFQDIKTEKDLDLLKRRITTDKALYARVVELRQHIHPKQNKPASGGQNEPQEGILEQNPAIPGVIHGPRMPTNAEMLALYKEVVARGEEAPNLEAELILKKLKTRSNSGVAVVSLLTKPFPCPGRCTYCPTEVNMPKSYLSKEPAAARALANDFDPYNQVTSRLDALVMNGHETGKIEMIAIGGTWSFYHPVYQEEFLTECYRACNNFGLPKEMQTKKGEKSLAQMQKENETALTRIIGLSIETRPDYITTYEIERLRKLGVTKVEIGVQHLDDSVLKETKRDMKIATVAEATERLRNAGLKVVYHMMPNLPGSTPERDIEMFGELFSGEDFHPDMLKMYPCMVLEGSELFDIWKKGGFVPYTDEELFRVLVGAKKQIPKYVRIIRVIRDIPATYIQAGSTISNLRQWLEADMKKNNWRCKCIRCREVRGMVVAPEKFPLTRTDYRTRTGTEVFLSFEEADEGKLASFLRLRLPDNRGEEFAGLPAPRPDTFYTYVILCDDSSFYIGQTSDLNKRFQEHQKGTGAEHTKKHRPIKIIHHEEYTTRDEAVKREKMLKTGFGRQWLKREYKAGRTRQAGGALDVLRGAALVRELHTYGRLMPVGAAGTQSQHIGFGKQLLIEAERIAREAGYKKVAIIAGIGVREYYRKRGYELEGTYMVKYL